MDLKDIVSNQATSAEASNQVNTSTTSTTTTPLARPRPTSMINHTIGVKPDPSTPTSPLGTANNAADYRHYASSNQIEASRRPRSLPSPEPSPESVSTGNKRSREEEGEEENNSAQPASKRHSPDASNAKHSIALMAPTTVSSTSSSSRRHAHILSEQRRRENINGGFQLLKNSVPYCRGTQDSKAMILKKAVEYIMQLEQELSTARSGAPAPPPPADLRYHPYYQQPPPHSAASYPPSHYDYNQQQLPPPPPASRPTPPPPPPPHSSYPSRTSTPTNHYYSTTNKSISRPTSTPPTINNYSYHPSAYGHAAPPHPHQYHHHHHPHAPHPYHQQAPKRNSLDGSFAAPQPVEKQSSFVNGSGGLALPKPV